MINRSCCTFLKKHVLTASVFLCLLLCADTSANAQSYFHLQTQSTATIPAYNYFLRMEADGSNTLRINYSKEGNNFLAEVLMTDSLAGNTNRFLIPKTAPRFIQSNTDDSLWLPFIQFESKTDSTGTYYEPAKIILTSREQQQPAVLTAKQKTYEDLVKEKALVLQFYKMNEPFYFFLSSFTTRNLNSDEQKRNFYLIIVANTNDPTIGKSSQKDLTGMYETFAVLTKQAGIGFIPVVISGDAFNIANTKQVIDTIKPAPFDIIFFYYTGHGFRYANDVSKYPRISFRTNTVQLRAENNLAIEKDIYEVLLKKRARVTIVISDCCNEKLGASVPVGLDMLRPRATGTEGLKLNFDNFRKLFLPAQPTSIIIGSAAPDQLAAGNPNMGGFFTNFFKAELIKALYDNTGQNSWLRISLNATENTKQQALTALCDATPNVRGRCVQRAEVRVLPPL